MRLKAPVYVLGVSKDSTVLVLPSSGLQPFQAYSRKGGEGPTWRTTVETGAVPGGLSPETTYGISP